MISKNLLNRGFSKVMRYAESHRSVVLDPLQIQAENTLVTYQHLCDQLRKNQKVYFSRFGDGDFFVMMGQSEKFHSFSESLQHELREAFSIQDDLFIRSVAVNYPKEPGMRPGIFAPHATNEVMSDFITGEFNLSPEDKFYSAIMFHYFSVFKQDLMVDFLNEFIRPKKKLYIGCLEKEKMERLVGPIHHHVVVPARDSYHTIDDWYDSVTDAAGDVELVLPCCGMASRVIQKRLWNSSLEVHSIDLGSVVDAACEQSTRTWIRKKGRRIRKLLLLEEGKAKRFFGFRVS